MTDKEATPQGVSRRDQMMEELIKKRAEETAKEEGREIEEEVDETVKPEKEDTPSEDTPSEDDPDKDAGEEQGEDQGEEGGGEEDPPPKMVSILGSDGKIYDVPADGRVKLKVDGEEVEETIDAVVRMHQKGAAGDKRLQQAAEMTRVLEQRASALSQREQEFLRKMKAADEKKAAGTLSSDAHKDTAKKLIDALLDADEDAAAELLGNVFAGPQPEQKGIDPEEVRKMVSDGVNEIAKAKELKDAQARFAKDYKDLHEDPYLFNLVDAETVKVMAEMPSATPWEIIDAAAKRVSDWRSKNGPAKAKPPVRRPPTPVSGRASIGKDKPVETREDVLKEMRAARGQPV